ncbi:MAG: exodeoxyribonuclease VII small subunit [Candidatus Shapirobacteria bacterium]|nr:exodeoxyribonuclease VII small subunit [Candidatus Shapirobacteria bacterium]
MNPKTSQTKNLATAFKELEKIAQQFEQGKIDLEQGIKELERGLELARFLKKQLSKIEHKVTEIKKSYQEIDD